MKLNTRHLDLHRTFLPWGYASTFNLRLQSSSVELSSAVDYLVRTHAFVPLADGSIIENIRGRSGRTALIGTLAQRIPLIDEELLVVVGESLADVTTSSSGLSSNEFQLLINTKFLDFKGSRIIRHKIVKREHGEVFAVIPFYMLGYSAPITPLGVRFGIELFRATTISSLLGVTPEIRTTILFEANSEEAAFQVIAERLSNRAQIPIEGCALASHINELCYLLSGSTLSEHYTLALNELHVGSA